MLMTDEQKRLHDNIVCLLDDLLYAKFKDHLSIFAHIDFQNNASIYGPYLVQVPIWVAHQVYNGRGKIFCLEISTNNRRKRAKYLEEFCNMKRLTKDFRNKYIIFSKDNPEELYTFLRLMRGI